jgi:hypothetical protein
MTEQPYSEQHYKLREATRKQVLSSSFGDHIRDTWINGPLLEEIAKELADMDLEDAIVEDLAIKQNLTEHEIYLCAVGAMDRHAAQLKKFEKVFKTIRKSLINTSHAVGLVRERNRLFSKK